MINKKRVFDLVFSFNDSKILQCRYEYLKNYIDYFVFIKFDNSQTLSSDKIIEFSFQDEFYKFNQTEFDNIFEFLNKKFDFNVEDVFLISKSFEVPNLENITNCISKLNYHPISLEQKSLMWDHNHFSKFNSIGTQIFNYSLYLSIKNIYDFLKTSSKFVIYDSPLCESGWNFSTFFDLDNFIKNTKFWNNLGVEEFEIIDSYYTGYDFRNLKVLENPYFDVPDDFITLGHRPNLREKLLVVISDNKSELTYGDYKVLLTDTDEIYEDIICYKIDYPNKVLYGDNNYIEFKYDYKKNEILKVFQSLKLIDDDEIHIKIKSERTSSDFICKFSEIKNGTPSLMF